MRHEVVFQPIVRLVDWQIIGYEALARFEDGRSPIAHLYDSRKLGDLVALELDLIATAIEESSVLPPEHFVAINASAETLVDPRLATMLQANRSREWGIELSEMSAVSFYERLQEVIRDLGVVLLIDDAGARFSDLERVQRSSPAIVKVDKSVLQAATDAVPDSTGLMKYCAAAHEVGALALAEGVETPAQARMLLDRGYELGQGYLFGHPAPANAWSARAN